MNKRQIIKRLTKEWKRALANTEKLENEAKKLAAAIAILSGNAASVKQEAKPKRKRKKMSAAARRKISAFQKQRWAKLRAAKAA